MEGWPSFNTATQHIAFPLVNDKLTFTCEETTPGHENPRQGNSANCTFL